MKILTVGDSFTYGDELADLSQAWSHLLSKLTGFSVDNLAKPAAGNTMMVRTVVENINHYDIFVIAWSHYARIEFSDEWGTYDVWPGKNPKSFDNKDISFRKSIIEYITKYHNDDYLYLQFLINILLIQKYLQFHEKKYIMVRAFGHSVETFLYNPRIKELSERIDTTYFIGWPNDSMMEWTHGVPKGIGGHFLDEGHQIVAEKIYENFRNFGWVS